MSFNGSGLFQINSAGQPPTAGTTITVAAHNALTADLATGLSTCITKDGQTTVTANIPMSTYKITGMGAATARTDATNLGNIQDGTGVYVGTVGGTADVITLTPSPAITSYTAGQTFRFIASGDNTTNVTVNISSLGAKAITKNGATALAAGDIPSGMMVEITYDGTRFILESAATSTINTPIINTPTINNATLTGDTSIVVSDARTNSVDVPLTLTSTTSNTPAAGIGTGILFKAESADENPCNFGQIETAASDVGAGSEDTYFQFLTRVAGAALTATYRFIATAANKAIFTHANSADRTYTFPNADGNVPVVASQAEVTAMTSTTTAITPNHNKIITAAAASLGGTSTTIATGLPSGLRRFTMSFVGLSTNGTNDLLIQIGPSGGVATSGYLGAAGTSGLDVNGTTGIRIQQNSASNVGHFLVICQLHDSATNTWVCVVQGGLSNSATTLRGGYSVSLSGELSQASITTFGGTDTFDAGTVSYSYER